MATNRRDYEGELRELLRDMSEIDVFMTYCFLCFKIRSEYTSRTPGGFWQELDITAHAIPGFFCWLDFELIKYFERKNGLR